MKPVRAFYFGGLVLLGACVPQAAPPLKPQPRPAPAPAPRPAPAPAPEQDWRDIALTPGNWSYRADGSATVASFGLPGAAPSFIVRCERGRGMIVLAREGITTGNTMNVRTSFGARGLPLSVQSEPPYVLGSLAASDPFLDSIAFSRGRFTVLVPGTALLVIPAWPEPARVIEDCR